MAYGISKYGLEIPTYDEWIQEYIDTFNNKRKQGGSTLKINESSHVASLFQINALQDIKIFQALEASHNSQTVNGAEDVYLDDLYGKRGIFRKGASAGGGMAIIKTGSTSPWVSDIPTTLKFNGSNGATYEPTSSVKLSKYVAAMIIPFASIGTSLAINGINSDTLVAVSETVDTTDLNDTVKAAVVTTLNSIFDGQSSLIRYDANAFYVGFAVGETEDPTGVAYPTEFYMNINIDKWSGVYVRSDLRGYYPLPKDGLSNVNPSSFNSGGNTVVISEATNFESFTSGSNVQTDAEYKAYAASYKDTHQAGTHPAMVRAMSSLAGVSKAAIFSNPSPDTRDGIPPSSFMVALKGGVDEDIAQTIYETMSLNSTAYGTTNIDITRSDGSIETIGFTKATGVSVIVKVEYVTSQRKAISTSAASIIRTKIGDYFNTLQIGATVLPQRLSAIVYSNVDYTDLESVDVTVSVDGSAFVSTKVQLPKFNYFNYSDSSVQFSLGA